MDSETSSKLSEEIDVIISSAARTTFDDRYDSALSVNALGPRWLLIFAKKCKKLNIFLHFSTAYEPYTFFQARFDDSNTRRLLKEMSMKDRKMFEFDARGIDWSITLSMFIFRV